MALHRVWVYGDNVNTDVIFPGKYTYTLKTREDIAAKALEDLDPAFAASAKPGDVIVAGRNWGSGSSREQAVTALKFCGIRAIIAESFGGIYFRNCINQGVLPIICTGIREVIHTGDEIEIDLALAEVRAGSRIFSFQRLSPSVQAIYDAGGLVPMLKRKFQS